MIVVSQDSIKAGLSATHSDLADNTGVDQRLQCTVDSTQTDPGKSLADNLIQIGGGWVGAEQL
jgi:predicted transcriptional regulator